MSGRSKNHLKRKVREWRTRYACAEQAEQAALRRACIAEGRYQEILRNTWSALDAGLITDKGAQAVLGITGFTYAVVKEMHGARKDMVRDLNQQLFGQAD